MQRHLFLGYLWILLAMPLPASTSRIYVPNTGGTTVDVIDPATNKVVQVLDNIVSPQAADFSPDGSLVYIPGGGDNALFVLERRSGKQIGKVPLSGYPNDVRVTRDGKLVLVCIRSVPGGLDVIDTKSLQRIKTIPTNAPLHDLEVTLDGKYAVLGAPEAHTLFVVDLQRKEVAWKHVFDREVMPIAIENAPDGSASRIFVDLRSFPGFAVLDFATREEVARIKFPDSSGQFGNIPASAGHGLRVAPDGKTLWANSTGANAAFVYSLPDLKLLGQVTFAELPSPGKAPLVAFPCWFAFTPDSKTVYIPNRWLNWVSAVDVKAIKEVARIPVGEGVERDSTLVLLDDEPTQATSEPPQSLDFEFFKSRVQPIFLKQRSADHARCFACHESSKHGSMFGPLRLEPLLPGHTTWTEEQSRRNFETVSKLVVPGDVTKSLFPMHALSPEAGGEFGHPHSGGRQFESQNDPDFQTIVQWIRGQKSKPSSTP